MGEDIHTGTPEPTSEKVLRELKEEGVEFPSDINKVLDSLPEDSRRIIISTLCAIEESSSFKGPMPPPEMLKGYEEILPGASERILRMAEKQQEHRMKIETVIVDRQTRQSGYGQIWGGILAVLFGGISFILGYTGHDVLAGVIATTTIVGLATIFVLHRASEVKEEEEKRS